MKPCTRLRHFLLLASSALLSAPLAFAAPYTWTQTASGTLDWTAGGNWADSTPYVSGAPMN